MTNITYNILFNKCCDLQNVMISTHISPVKQRRRDLSCWHKPSFNLDNGGLRTYFVNCVSVNKWDVSSSFERY